MKTSSLLLFVLSVFVLSSCSWLEEWPPREREFTKRAPEPQPRVMQTADATWLAPDQSGALPVTHGAPERDEAAMDRLERLERDVADLRSEMGMMLPALTRLAQAQTDLQSILQRYEGGQGVVGAAQGAPTEMRAHVTPAPYYPSAPQPAPQQSQSNSLAPSSSYAAYPPQNTGAAQGLYVRQVRFGEHGDKTRMVLDASGAVKFRYDLDNSEQILVLDLPGTSWQGATQNMLKNAPLVASYSVSSDGQGGSRMAIQLRAPVKVLLAEHMAPAAGKGHRIVLDIAPF